MWTSHAMASDTKDSIKNPERDDNKSQKAELADASGSTWLSSTIGKQNHEKTGDFWVNAGEWLVIFLKKIPKYFAMVEFAIATFLKRRGVFDLDVEWNANQGSYTLVI